MRYDESLVIRKLQKGSGLRMYVVSGTFTSPLFSETFKSRRQPEGSHFYYNPTIASQFVFTVCGCTPHLLCSQCFQFLLLQLLPVRVAHTSPAAHMLLLPHPQNGMPKQQSSTRQEQGLSFCTPALTSAVCWILI